MQTVAAADRWLYAWGLASVATGGVSLLVPLYVVTLGGGPIALGALASSAAIVGAPGAVLVGRFADRTGHRRSLLLGALAGLVGCLLALPLLSSITLIVAVNAALWLCWAAVVPVLTMLVVEAVPESRWNGRIARLNAFQGWGWAGGLVLGMAWTAVGAGLTTPATAQRTLFVGCGLCAAGGLGGIARTLPVEARTSIDRPGGRRIARLLVTPRNRVTASTFLLAPNRLYWSTRSVRPGRLLGRFTPSLGLFFLAALLFFAGSAAFWAPLPVYLAESGYPDGTVFGLFLAASLASALLYAPAGRLSDRLDSRRLLAGALAARGVLLPGVALVGVAGGLTDPDLLLAVVLLAGIGATWAVIAVAGTAIVATLSAASVRGELLGFYTALGAVAGGVGGILGGWLAARNYALGFGAAGGLVLVGAILVFALRRRAGVDQHAQGPTAHLEGGP